VAIVSPGMSPFWRTTKACRSLMAIGKGDSMSAELVLVIIFAVSLIVKLVFLRKTKESRTDSLAQGRSWTRC
jgi:hypothetical protein